MIPLAFYNNLMGPDGLVILVAGLLFVARRLRVNARYGPGEARKPLEDWSIELLVLGAMILMLIAIFVALKLNLV